MANIFGRMRMAVAALIAGLGAVVAAPGEPVHAQGARPPVTLVIANSQWLDALRGDNLWKAMLKYNRVAPNATLQQEAIPSAQFSDRIMTEMGAGLGPDILMMQDELFFPLADAGLLVPVDKAVEGIANLNGTNGGAIINGKRYGIAWHRAVYAFIYNKPILDAAGVKPPASIDELIAAARDVTAKTGVIGFTARHQIADFSGWFKDFQNWAYGYGVNWVGPAGKLTIDTPEALAAVAAFKKVYDARIIPIGDDMTTQRSRFKERKAAMSIDNSGSTLNLVSGGALQSADLMAAPLPFAKPGAHQQIFIGVSARSKNQAAAMDFLRWLVGAEGQQALREASGPDTLATDVPISKEYEAANPWAATFVKLATTSRSLLIPGYETRTGEVMRAVMEAVEKVIVANADPKAALAEAQKKVDAKF